jgi:tripartite-type tricarboxylate transporter receptor subunit TctC
VAPTGTPAEAVARLEAAMRWALTETDLPQAFVQQGVVARYRDSAATRAFIAAERERWTRVVREAGITVD